MPPSTPGGKRRRQRQCDGTASPRFSSSLSVHGAESAQAVLKEVVVKVIVPNAGRDNCCCSGFFLHRTGLLLTCRHVFDPEFRGANPDQLFIEFKRQRFRAVVVDRRPEWSEDVAFLQVKPEDMRRLKRAGFRAAPMAFPFHPGDPVAALGFQRPDELEDTLLVRGYVDPDNTSVGVPLKAGARGTGTRVSRMGIAFRGMAFDVGISGAPLVDLRTGYVIGMVAGLVGNYAADRISGAVRRDFLGLAIPLQTVAQLCPDFRQTCDVLDYDPALDDEIVPQAKEILRHHDFTERPDWTAALWNTLAREKTGYLLLVGGEGQGKTAFASHCLSNTVQPIFHLLRRSEPGWNDPGRMLRSLTAQLMLKHRLSINAGIFQRLKAAKSEEIRMRVAAELFADVLQRLSKILSLDGRQEVVWIDGLDEVFGPTADHYERPGLASLLPQFVPAGVQIVMTSRPGDHLHWLSSPEICSTFCLEDFHESNVADVRRYFTEHAREVDPPLDPDFIQRAAERTQGNFYVAVHKFAEIKRNPSAARDPDATPRSVREFHAEVYQRVVTRAARDGIPESEVRSVLGALAEAREPLTLEHMEAFGFPGSGERLLRWAADYFRPRPAARDPELRFEFNHTSVQEFLSMQLSALEREKAHQHFAQALCEWQKLPARVQPYALLHRPAHLARAGREFWDALCDLLMDFDFLQARVHSHTPPQKP